MSHFEDVFPENVHADDIEWLADAGITKGINPPDNTRFGPDLPVLREQMASFLRRLNAHVGPHTPAYDDSELRAALEQIGLHYDDDAIQAALADLRSDFDSHGPHGASGAAGFADIGHRYVSTNGSNSADGLSPATAHKSIQESHDSLQQSGVGRGGLIWLGKGEHVCNNVDITNWSTSLIGAGENTTRLLITQNGAYGLKVTGERCKLRDFSITDRSNAGSSVKAKTAIWLDDAQETVVENVFVDGLGDDYTGGKDFDDMPAAIRVSGISEFGDWITLRRIRTRNVGGSGLLVQSGSNGWVDKCIFGGEYESVWVKRRDHNVGKSCSWRFLQTQFLGGGPGSDDYSVRLESDISDHHGRLHFIGCFLELSGATNNSNGFYVDLTDVQFTSCMFDFAGASDGKKLLRVGPHGQVVVDAYVHNGVDAGDFVVDAGGSLSCWSPKDYTGP